MGIIRIHGLSVKRWATRCSIGPANTSIIGSSKIIVASNSGIIRCVALGPLKQRHASVGLLTNCASISVLAARWAKWSLSRNNAGLFFSVLPLSRQRYKQLVDQRARGEHPIRLGCFAVVSALIEPPCVASERERSRDGHTMRASLNSTARNG